MKDPLDKFSRQSEFYRKYRPQYPKALYDHILSFVNHRSRCWDCGTGNGQVALQLSSSFEQLEATDISAAQLDLAERRNNIRYSLQRAESTNFPDSHFDLITSAQAAHWFDIEAFNKEVHRVGRPGSVLAIWGYDLPRIDEKIDHLVDTFYHEIVGAYWNAERRHVEDHYERLNFDMSTLPTRNDLFTATRWYQEEFIGYLHSWSSVQNYRKANSGKDPIDWMIEEVSSQWDQSENKEVRFPIFLKLGTLNKV